MKSIPLENMDSMSWIFMAIAILEQDAFYYKGDILPQVVAAWVEDNEWYTGPVHGIVIKSMALFDIKWHSKGHCALYGVNLETGEFQVLID